MKTYEDINSAYLGTLADVYDNPDFVASPRGQKTREKLDYQFRILNPLPNAIITNDKERNKTIESYTKKEYDLYNSMTNSVQDFGKASKFWLKLANPNKTVNSAYGYLIWKNKSHGNPYFEKHDELHHLQAQETLGIIDIHEYYRKSEPLRKSVMRTPWEWAKHSLKQDKDTRQALLRFSLPEHQWVGNKDQTCTLHGLFNIRENKLNFSVTMRSNDLTLGLVYDLPWFISLMYRMVDDLKDTYPDLEIGHYTHNVTSLHIYERDENKILKMLGRK